MTAKAKAPEGKVRWTELEWKVGDIAFTADDEAVRIDDIGAVGPNEVAYVIYLVGRYIGAADWFSTGDLCPITQKQLDERSIEDIALGIIDAPMRTRGSEYIDRLAALDSPGVATPASLAKRYRERAENVEREGFRR